MELVARAQLEFVRRLIARFKERPPAMQPLDVHQARYVAIIAMLRGIGHVFEKVDCDTDEKKSWAKRKWLEWKARPIFKEFIDPTRNALLKEFEGGLTLRAEGMSSPAIVSDPSMPDSASVVLDFDVSRAIAPNGKPLLKQFDEAIEFWERNLRQAEFEWASTK
jgi:hypothetical protein